MHGRWETQDCGGTRQQVAIIRTGRIISSIAFIETFEKKGEHECDLFESPGCVRFRKCWEGDDEEAGLSGSSGENLPGAVHT